MSDSRNQSQEALACLADALADLVAERLEARLSGMARPATPPSPWLTTRQAIEYSALPAGTFRKLAACGKIPSHGGRTKLFYRPELDQSLLELEGIADGVGRLRRAG